MKTSMKTSIKKFNMKKYLEGVDMVAKWLGETYGVNSKHKRKGLDD